MNLYIVRGWDVGGENQDWHVVAPDVDGCIAIWNDTLILNGFPRDGNDDETTLPRRRTVEPRDIRRILADVADTPFSGGARAVEWDELPLVFAKA